MSTLRRAQSIISVNNNHAVLPSDTLFAHLAGAGIGLVIENAKGQLRAMAIKHALSAKLTKIFSQACEDLKASRRFIVYSW